MELRWQPKAILIAGGLALLLLVFLVAFPLYLLNEADKERRRRMSEPARQKRWAKEQEPKADPLPQPPASPSVSDYPPAQPVMITPVNP